MNKLIVRVVNKFGRQHQTMKAMEELAELIVALSHGNVENIKEECADVEILIEQIKYMYDIDTTSVKTFKLARLGRRLDGKEEW